MPFDLELLQKAREAWIEYSTPLWRRAGRSEAWIAQNIIDEWATSQDDIVRRYLAGDFTLLYICSYCGASFGSQIDLDAHIAEAHPGLPIAGVWDWLKTNAPYLIMAGLGVSSIAILAVKAKKKH